MNRIRCFLILAFSFSPFCSAQEEKPTTQVQDKMTLEKARAALAETEEPKALNFKPIFDLPEGAEPEIIDTKLTYRKALAALKDESKEVKRLTALVKKKRLILTKMIGSYAGAKVDGKLQATPKPPYTLKQYEEAKAAYESARDQLRKMNLPDDKRVLFQKKSKK